MSKHFGNFLQVGVASLLTHAGDVSSLISHRRLDQKMGLREKVIKEGGVFQL